jgi:CDP-glucose 4,6-dehydratase
MVNADFWKSRRVFITGHTGFKGSWLAKLLVTLGADLCGYSLAPPTEPNLFHCLALETEMRSVIGDVRNAERIQQEIDNFKPEVVLHLAAQPLVRDSYQVPVETYATNVMGTVHILDALRRSSDVRVFLGITSDKCYENREWIWPYRENEPMGGFDPYSSSKGCAELVINAYRHSFFPPERFDEHRVAIASARAGNVIGGGDWAKDRLIPDLVRGFSKGDTVTIRNPAAIRPWQHVLEPITGYLLLAERLWSDGTRYASGWNFGPLETDTRTVQQMVARAAEIWGRDAKWQVDDADRVHEAQLLKLDSTKARVELGWQPRWSWEQALDQTFTWYSSFYAGEDMRQFSLNQLHSYGASCVQNSGKVVA